MDESPKKKQREIETERAKKRERERNIENMVDFTQGEREREILTILGGRSTFAASGPVSVNRSRP